MQLKDSSTLATLEKKFSSALHLKNAGKLNDSEDLLREILKIEPRIAEPRLELARLMLDTGRLHDAREHAEEGLHHLKTTGQWVEDLDENVITALAHGLIAEILRQIADEDDVIFGDPDTFNTLIRLSKEHFAKAAALDPSDAFSSYYAFFMGIEGVQPSIGGSSETNDPAL